MKRLMIAKNSIVKNQNLAMNHISLPVKSNSGNDQVLVVIVLIRTNISFTS